MPFLISSWYYSHFQMDISPLSGLMMMVDCKMRFNLKDIQISQQQPPSLMSPIFFFLCTNSMMFAPTYFSSSNQKNLCGTIMILMLTLGYLTSLSLSSTCQLSLTCHFVTLLVILLVTLL